MFPPTVRHFLLEHPSVRHLRDRYVSYTLFVGLNTEKIWRTNYNHSIHSFGVSTANNSNTFQRIPRHLDHRKIQSIVVTLSCLSCGQLYAMRPGLAMSAMFAILLVTLDLQQR